MEIVRFGLLNINIRLRVYIDLLQDEYRHRDMSPHTRGGYYLRFIRQLTS